MGKASRWFRAVLGLKKPDPPPSQHQQTTTSRSKEKRRWSFVKSYREKEHSHHQIKTSQEAPVMVQSSSEYEQDPDKHAIAVAAATAAVAKAAVAAAHAAAEVVRLTSSGRCANNSAAMPYVNWSHGWREDFAAVKIQTAFRGYLARRALRALKALVRLQALVRGHIERKRTTEWLRRMQAIWKAQARARAGRIQISESSHSSSKSSHFHHPGPPTPEKFEHAILARSGKYEQSSMLKRTGSKSNGKAISDEDVVHSSFNWSEPRMDERSWEQRVPLTRTGTMDDEKSAKILEIDTGKTHFTPNRRNLFHSSHHALASDRYFTTSKDSTTHHTVPSPSSGEVQSLSPLKFPREDEEAFCTAENSPQFYSASSRGGSGRRSPFTPSRSNGSTSFLSGFSDYYPNYMSYTESSRAKVRSLSAPRQRPQYERSSSAKRYSLHGFGELRLSSAQRGSVLRASFTSKAYPGSGHLDRLGMPVGQRY